MKYSQVHLKPKSWTLLALIFMIFIHSIISIKFKPSPCPNKFVYESVRGSDNDRWYGDITLPIDDNIEGSTIRIGLDKPSQLIATTAGSITSIDNQVYIITHDNVVLEKGTTYKLIFMVKYDNTSREVPMLETIHFNGRRICPPDLVSLSLDGGNGYLSSRPDIKGTEPTDVISDIDKRPNTPTRTTTRPTYVGDNEGNFNFNSESTSTNRYTTNRSPNSNNFNSGGSNLNNLGNNENQGSTSFNSGNSNNFGTNPNNFGGSNANQGSPGLNSGNSNQGGSSLNSGNSNNFGSNSNPPSNGFSTGSSNNFGSSTNQGNNGFNSGSSNNFGSNSNQGSNENNFGGSGSAQGNSIRPNQGSNSFNTGSNNFGSNNNQLGGNSNSNNFAGNNGNKFNEGSTNGKVACGTVSIANPLITLAQNTEYGQWPWHAALFMKDELNPSKSSYICGGSLVSKNKVITAAHCVSLSGNRIVNPDSLTVYLGKFNIHANEETSQRREVIDLKVNPKYNKANFHDDIAILILASDVEFTNYVRPICIWETAEGIEDVVNKEGIVVGWGYNEHQQLNEELKMAPMPIVSSDKCARSDAAFFAEYVSENAFCAGYKNGTGPCKGDSGGGLVIKRNDAWYLRGIVSVSAAPKNGSVCNTYHYIVFTDVAKYTDFIRRNL